MSASEPVRWFEGAGDGAGKFQFWRPGFAGWGQKQDAEDAKEKQ